MRTITIHIEEETFILCKERVAFRDFSEGCVSPPDLLERIMITAIHKMDQGVLEMIVTNTNKKDT